MTKKNSAGLILKPTKDKAIRNYHHWIFSGAVASLSEEIKNGEIASVYSSTGDELGSAYVNRASSIVARMVAFGSGEPVPTILENIQLAIAFRQELFHAGGTNAYRLINAEGDRLPGLIVDRYGDVLVVQISTLGMERLKSMIVEELTKALRPHCIYEKSDMGVRQEEGLKPELGILAGKMPEEIMIQENNLNFWVDVEKGQKTGFFLDQREMRSLVKNFANGKNVLNCFSYTGGFSIAALAGGARHAVSVDISPEAINFAEKNAVKNGFAKQHEGIAADVFLYLRALEKNTYDFIVLDPPAFTKRKTDVVAACRGYKDINRLAITNIASGGYILTSSCSHFVDEKLFQTVVFQAAREANRMVRIIGRHRLAPDHPVNIYHPEGEYLKSLFLQVV